MLVERVLGDVRKALLLVGITISYYGLRIFQWYRILILCVVRLLGGFKLRGVRRKRDDLLAESFIHSTINM